MTGGGEFAITIAGRRIAADAPPFIVAEMSGNHNQSFERALAIVDAAAASGAHALKLQTYTADTMTIDTDRRDFFISDPTSLWAGKSLYELYQQAHTPWEWHKPIFDRCRRLGMIAFSTPFDETAVEFLESLDVPCYKIASFENTDLPLLRKVANTGKPVILSTGMASLDELEESVGALRSAGCRELVLLRCTSAYPAMPHEANLRAIPDMQSRFQCPVGVSDHTPGIAVSIAAVALGAAVIEKHFTLNRADGGVDAAFSLEPGEFNSLVAECDSAWRALGTASYGVTEGEKKSLVYRRSVYIVKDMDAGEKFTRENLRLIRPGYGLAPKHFDAVLGHRITRAAKAGTPLAWDLISS